MTSPTTSAPHPSAVAAPAPAQIPVTAAAAVLEQRRDTDSPGTIHPFPSITEFIEDSSAKLGTPERIPTPPKAPITDVLNPQDTNLLRPPSTSPLDSEVDEEQENNRLVSIEEFLRQDQQPTYCRTQQVSSDLLTTTNCIKFILYYKNVCSSYKPINKKWDCCNSGLSDFVSALSDLERTLSLMLVALAGTLRSLCHNGKVSVKKTKNKT